MQEAGTSSQLRILTYANLHQADAAMYQAKREGSGHYAVHAA